MADDDGVNNKPLPLPPRLIYPPQSISGSKQEDNKALPLPPSSAPSLANIAQEKHSNLDNTPIPQYNSSLPLPPRSVESWKYITNTLPISNNINANKGPSWEPSIVVKNLHYIRRRGKTSFTISIPNLEVYPGELTCIRGEKGSGKSTLIKLLALEFTPKEGDIYTLGENVRKLSHSKRDDLRGEGITYIPQSNFGLMANRTATENIQRLLHDYLCFDWSEATKRAHDALLLVGLSEQSFNKKIIPDLSGGERAMVAVAKAYATERPICLMDEILAPIDPDSQKAILHLFQKLAALGYTVIVIVHEELLKYYFHRVIKMRDGKIIEDQRQIPKSAMEREGR